MIFESSKFTFTLPPNISWARQILIKSSTTHPLAYPISTSPKILGELIAGIRRVSDADIILLEGNPENTPMAPIYKVLGYEFPRVLMLDVKDCNYVEVENPLPRPFVIPTFWLPNVVLYCDYLISVTPFRILSGQGDFSIRNLLSLLPVAKYSGLSGQGWGDLYDLGIDKVIADLYFTLPFDLGIIEGHEKFVSTNGITKGAVEAYNKIFAGEPYEVDTEASRDAGIDTTYLHLIETAKAQIARQELSKEGNNVKR